MADNYTVQGTSSDIQVTGPSTVLDVVIIAATAQPSGVYFQVAVPADTYKTDGESAIVSPVADGVNWLAQRVHIGAVIFQQNLDASGLLAYYMVATVTIPTPPGRTGPFSLQLPIPLGILAEPTPQRNSTVDAMVHEAVVSLQTTAGVPVSDSSGSGTPGPITSPPPTPQPA